MKKVLLVMATLFVCSTLIVGCGSFGGGGKRSETGSIEGYVYVPESGKGTSTVRLTRQAGPPLGYIALYGADVRVEINGQVAETKTDASGHFKIGGLPTGLAKVTITPPLAKDTGLAEFLTFTTTMEVKANTTAYIGSDGNISVISYSADHLEVTTNQIVTTNFPTIECYLSVIDPVRNTPIIGLTQDNFEVKMAGDPVNTVNVQQVSSHNVPASFCLVLDRSGSMSGIGGDDQPLKDAQNAAKQFVAYVSGGDRVEIISFSHIVSVDCPFTADKQALVEAIEQLTSGGATALYDATAKGISESALEFNQKKAVIVMTDGGENSSISATLSSVITLAKQANIPVYTIGLQGFDFTRSSRSGSEKSDSGREVRSVREVRSEQDLQLIARETGGEYFYAPQSSDLMGIYTKITQRQQQQYILTFEDLYPKTPGVRDLEIKVRAAGLEGTSISQYGRTSYDYPVNPALYIPGSYAGRSFYYNPWSDKPHLGEDIDLPEGTPIRAIGDGRIVQYEAHQGYGELVAVIEHDLGRVVHFDLDVGDTKQKDTQYICSIYGHIRASEQRDSTPLPWKVGDTVKRGDVIGYINNSSHPDGVYPDPNGDGKEHLHMGIRLTRHPGRWAYYGYEDTTNPYANVKDFAAFSEVISILNQ